MHDLEGMQRFVDAELQLTCNGVHTSNSRSDHREATAPPTGNAQMPEQATAPLIGSVQMPEQPTAPLKGSAQMPAQATAPPRGSA